MNFEARLQRIAGQTQQLINSATSGMEEEARERLLEEDQPRDNTEILVYSLSDGGGWSKMKVSISVSRQ